MDTCFIGIDFGTTNSLISIYKDGSYELLSFENGDKYLPSVVYFKEDNEVVVGANAKSVVVIEPELTISNVKRDIGSNKNFKINDSDFKVEDIAYFIFKKIKKNIDNHLNLDGNSEIEAVITVPAYFNHIQREIVRALAELAGINAKLLLNEPTAAYIYYKNLLDIKSGKYLVIDLGGGTFDLSLIESNGKYIKVLASSGSTEIGGVDFDYLIADYLVKQFYDKYSIDLKKDKVAYQQLLIKSEIAKKELLTSNEVDIVIPYISNDGVKPLHFKESISRECFKNVSENLIQKLIDSVRNFIEEQDVKVDSILLVGGGIKLFFIEDLIKDAFDINIQKVINPEEAVVKGASISHYFLNSNENFFQDVISHNLGVEDDNGEFQVILNKYEPYPIKKTMVFTNSKDNLKEIIIHILQEIKDNKTNVISENSYGYLSLGLVKFPLKENLKKGEADINVSFIVNENAIVEVEVEDLSTSNELLTPLNIRFDFNKFKNLKIF